jgi:RNA polymerase sigma-70 factor (ECF subfamily)
MGPTDAELCARVIAVDDRHAFATLVRRHQAAVRALLRRLACGDQALADDLAQETFLRAYHALPTWRGGGKLVSWLYAIAHRAFLSHARSPAARAHDDLDEPRAEVGPGAVVDARHDLERALRVLGPDERAALALTYAEDMTHEEAARVLDLPLGTLKTRVRDAKEKLRRELERDGARAREDR